MFFLCSTCQGHSFASQAHSSDQGHSLVLKDYNSVHSQIHLKAPANWRVLGSIGESETNLWLNPHSLPVGSSCLGSFEAAGLMWTEDCWLGHRFEYLLLKSVLNKVMAFMSLIVFQITYSWVAIDNILGFVSKIYFGINCQWRWPSPFINNHLLFLIPNSGQVRSNWYYRSLNKN